MKGSLILVLIFIFCSFNTHAQLCTGSLGDPALNISSGRGTNPGPTLSAAATLPMSPFKLPL